MQLLKIRSSGSGKIFHTIDGKHMGYYYAERTSFSVGKRFPNLYLFDSEMRCQLKVEVWGTGQSRDKFSIDRHREDGPAIIYYEDYRW